LKIYKGERVKSEAINGVGSKKMHRCVDARWVGAAISFL